MSTGMPWSLSLDSRRLERGTHARDCKFRVASRELDMRFVCRPLVEFALATANPTVP
jgi:hypothetical protein